MAIVCVRNRKRKLVRTEELGEISPPIEEWNWRYTINSDITKSQIIKSNLFQITQSNLNLTVRRWTPSLLSLVMAKQSFLTIATTALPLYSKIYKKKNNLIPQCLNYIQAKNSKRMRILIFVAWEQKKTRENCQPRAIGDVYTEIKINESQRGLKHVEIWIELLKIEWRNPNLRELRVESQRRMREPAIHWSLV